MSGAATLLMSGKGATVPEVPTGIVATVPEVPTGIVATAVCTKSASVTFTPPADNGGSPITGYRVTSSPGGLFNIGTSSPIVVSGLTRGVAYTFTVFAINAVGAGPISSPSNSITAIDAPGAPTIGALTQVGPHALSVTFTPPADNGGSAITGYRVEFLDETAQFTGGVVFVAGSPATLNSDANSVRTGWSYGAMVFASNATCESVGSAESNIVVIA